MCTADALSRAPTLDEVPPEDTEFLVQAVVAHLPADRDRLDCYRQAQKIDPICLKVLECVNSGWPSKHQVSGDVTLYWSIGGELSVCDDLLLRGTRIVVPPSLQKETLLKIHQGHQGIQKCRQRVAEAVWWPGISQEIEDLVKSCPVCVKATSPREPLLLTTRFSVGESGNRFV